MGEHGTICFKHIYCDSCREAVLNTLSSDDFTDVSVEALGTIIVGEILGCYSGQEHVDFQYYYGPAIAQKICHEVRVAILAESDSATYTIVPGQVDIDPDPDLVLREHLPDPPKYEKPKMPPGWGRAVRKEIENPARE